MVNVLDIFSSTVPGSDKIPKVKIFERLRRNSGTHYFFTRGSHKDGTFSC